MYRILLRHTYVVIFLQLFSLIGSFYLFRLIVFNTDKQMDKVKPAYPLSTSLKQGYKNSFYILHSGPRKPC